jgi:hypothetical protein
MSHFWLCHFIHFSLHVSKEICPWNSKLAVFLQRDPPEGLRALFDVLRSISIHEIRPWNSENIGGIKTTSFTFILCFIIILADRSFSSSGPSQKAALIWAGALSH